jgi:dihydrodipicolinate synthase/N-acetylneuraminate lyase
MALQGIYPVLPTPLTDDASFDSNGMSAIVDFAADHGMDGALVLGSNGEAPYFMTDEKVRIIEAACAAAGKRLPVMVGIITSGTDEAVHLSQVAQRSGAASVLVALPQYYGAKFGDIKRHYQAICKAVTIPVLYYNFPACTHLKLRPEQVADVCALDGIMGMKESVLNLREIRAHIRLIRKPGFAVFSGTTYLYPAVVRSGGVGLICPIPLLATDDAVALRDALASGDRGAADRHHRRLFETLPVMSGKVGVPVAIARMVMAMTSWLGLPLSAAGEMPHAAIKEALRLQGVPISTRVRAPLQPLDDKRRALVATVMRRLHPVVTNERKLTA